MTTNSDYFETLQDLLAGGVHYNFRTHGKEHLNFVTRARNSRVWDIEGNEYLDLYAKFGAMIVGHGNKHYNEFLKAQIDKVVAVNHSDLDFEACELIKNRFPGMEQMRFCLSGTEAIQNAIRLARAYTKKDLFLRVEGHYHGNSDNIMGGKLGADGDPHPVEFSGDPRGTEGRLKGAFRDQSLMVKWNDIEGTERVIKAYHDEIAAFILEPILINGGGIAPEADYLRTIRELCTQYNIVLIYDEIITGFRVGKGGAQHLYSVIPDLTVLGKAISGGVPVSVLGGKKAIMELYANRRVIHAGTFNGYPLGMAAVIATMHILEDAHFAFYSRAERYLTEIKNIMTTACEENDIEFNMSIFGSVGVFNCQKQAIRTPDDIDYRTAVVNSILFRTFPKFGILISPVTRLFINTQFSEHDIEYFEAHARKAVRQCRTEIDNVFR